MATEPFNPNEALPEDDDVVALFPAVERTFRDVMESWVISEHGRTGHHAFPIKTTTQRDAITNWEAGSVVYNSTTKQFQLSQTIDPDVFVNLTDFPSGYRTVGQQTSAPTGWTKEVGAAYNDALAVGSNGSVTTSGSSAVSAVLTSRTITQAHLPAVSLTVNITDPGHVHSTTSGSTFGGATTAIVSNSTANVSVPATPADLAGLTTNNTTTGITATASLGGSGSAFDFDAKKFGVCVFQKD